MPQRLELIGKTKATITAIEILSLKMGQTDVQPAVCLTLNVRLPNSKLAMLDATLRDFLYTDNSDKPKTQQQLEGVEVVSDRPNLTPAAEAIGALHWEYEQSGCKLKVYSGVTGQGNISLKDGTLRKVKLDPKEGGTVELTFQFHTADVDAETIGDLGVLKSLERDVELTAPEVISAQSKIDVEPDAEGEELTPEKAFKQAVEEQGTAAQGRTAKQLKAQAAAKKKTSLARKVAHSSRRAAKTSKAD